MFQNSNYKTESSASFIILSKPFSRSSAVATSSMYLESTTLIKHEACLPSILATYYAVTVMNFLAIDIHNKEGLLDYTNKLAKESFIK